MEVHHVQVVATVLAFIAFCAVLVWVMTPTAKRRSEEAAQLPFADDEKNDE